MYGRERAWRLGFVGDHYDAPARHTQDLRDLLIERIDPGLRIDDEDYNVGFLRSGFGLPPCRFREFVTVRGVRIRIDTRRVDHAERAATPFAQRVEPVARHAGRVLDDREALSDQPVEEGTLPDVWTSDDGDGRRPQHRTGRRGGLLHRLSFRGERRRPRMERKQAVVVRWVLIWVGAYGITVFALIAVAQYAARANPLTLNYFSSTYGDYAVAIYADYPLPFHMNGGVHPGTVELFEDGRMIDSERVDDVTSVHDVRFDQYNAYFRYVSHGMVYQSTLQIIQ